MKILVTSRSVVEVGDNFFPLENEIVLETVEQLEILRDLIAVWLKLNAK